MRSMIPYIEQIRRASRKFSDVGVVTSVGLFEDRRGQISYSEMVVVTSVSRRWAWPCQLVGHTVVLFGRGYEVVLWLKSSRVGQFPEHVQAVDDVDQRSFTPVRQVPGLKERRLSDAILFGGDDKYFDVRHRDEITRNFRAIVYRRHSDRLE